MVATLTRSAAATFRDPASWTETQPLVVYYSGIEEAPDPGGRVWLHGSARLEVWKQGARVSMHDVMFGEEMDAHSEPVPFGWSVRGGDSAADMGFGTGHGSYDTFNQGTLAPSGAYELAGRPGERLDLFANGRAIYRDASGTHDCYPTAVASAGKRSGVSGCRVDGPDGATVATFAYLPHQGPGESPAPIRATIADDVVDLYPY